MKFSVLIFLVKCTVVDSGSPTGCKNVSKWVFWKIILLFLALSLQILQILSISFFFLNHLAGCLHDKRRRTFSKSVRWSLKTVRFFLQVSSHLPNFVLLDYIGENFGKLFSSNRRVFHRNTCLHTWTCLRNRISEKNVSQVPQIRQRFFNRTPFQPVNSDFSPNLRQRFIETIGKQDFCKFNFSKKQFSATFSRLVQSENLKS